MTAKTLFLGLFWILLGIFAIFARTVDAIEISAFILVLSYSISILFIVIGTCFIFRKRWANKAMFYLSTVLIVGICGLGIKMTIYGIIDITKFQSLASTIKLLFGFTIILSSS